MKCPKCSKALQIANSKMEFEGDKSTDTETKAFQVMQMVCKNPSCSNFSKDLDNPIVLETVRVPLN